MGEAGESGGSSEKLLTLYNKSDKLIFVIEKRLKQETSKKRTRNMPNHTTNKLAIMGDAKEVTKFIDRVNRGPEDQFNFNSIIPMPDELRLKRLEKWDDVGKNVLLRERFGFDNSYDWAVANWGTKWGAYNTGNWDSVGKFENYELLATIGYFTAWTPASAFYMNASKLFPTLLFTHRYMDEGNEFIGEQSIQNGVLIESIEYEWESIGADEIRADLNGE